MGTIHIQKYLYATKRFWLKIFLEYESVVTTIHVAFECFNIDNKKRNWNQILKYTIFIYFQIKRCKNQNNSKQLWDVIGTCFMFGRTWTDRAGRLSKVPLNSLTGARRGGGECIPACWLSKGGGLGMLIKCSPWVAGKWLSVTEKWINSQN